MCRRSRELSPGQRGRRVHRAAAWTRRLTASGSRRHGDGPVRARSRVVEPDSTSSTRMSALAADRKAEHVVLPTMRPMRSTLPPPPAPARTTARWPAHARDVLLVDLGHDVHPSVRPSPRCPVPRPSFPAAWILRTCSRTGELRSRGPAPAGRALYPRGPPPDPLPRRRDAAATRGERPTGPGPRTWPARRGAASCALPWRILELRAEADQLPPAAEALPCVTAAAITR